MSVDLRTRIDGREPHVAPHEFLDSTLPALVGARSDLVAGALARLRLRPLTMEVDGEPWSLAPEGSGIRMARGSRPDPGGIRVRFDAATFEELVADQVTPVGLFVSGRLDQPEGQVGHLLDWWLLLRSVLDDRPVAGDEAVPLHDRDGTPLDLGAAHRIDDDPDVLAHFLREAGFLHLRGVFSAEEMAEVSADMDRAAPGYARDDGNSWWAHTADGTDRLVRMQAFDEHSPITKSFLDGDSRLATIAALTGDGHVGRPRGTKRIEALYKPIGVVDGISDVPWHKDCSLGRHSYECCSLTVGISVTGADAESGQLHVVPGSHRQLRWPSLLRPDEPAADLALPTATGDVTVHLSCTLHMAQPPVSAERRVLYTGFGLPPVAPDAVAAARRRLGAIREAAPVMVSQAEGHTAGRRVGDPAGSA